MLTAPGLLQILRQRHSSRVLFDRERRLREDDLRQILEAARWAPTAHNMQNFELVVVEDAALLSAIGAIVPEPTPTFLRENYEQLSFSEAELQRKGTGVLASMFPESWRSPDAASGEGADAQRALGRAMPVCPALLVVVYDGRKRAPASEADVLGIMSLGCVMQNMWLMAEALGIGMQILSAFSQKPAEDELHRILEIPIHSKVAFVCRVGYPQARIGRYLRVRREVGAFVHRNRYGRCEP